MSVGEMLLALLNPNLPGRLLNAIMGIINLVCIAGGITLLAYLLKSLRRGKNPVEAEQASRKPSTMCFLGAITVMAALIGLYVAAGVKFQTDTAEPESYSIFQLLQAFVAVLDPLLDVSGLAKRPIQGLFGLNLLALAGKLYVLKAAIQVMVKKMGQAAVRFDIFLKEKFLADAPEADQKINSTEEAKDEIQSLLKWLSKWVFSGGALVVGTYILGTEDVQGSIESVTGALTEILELVTLFPQVGKNGDGVSGFFTDIFFVLLSLVMLAVYATAALLLVIFIHTIVKNWSQIVDWVVARAKQMRRGTAIVLQVLVGLGLLIGAGVCLQKYPILRLYITGGLPELVRIVVNYIALILAITAILLLLAVAIVFVRLVVIYAAEIVRRLVEAWTARFDVEVQWRMARVAACVVLSGAFLVVLALNYPTVRDWLAGIFHPAEGVLQPFDVIKLAALLVLLLDGIVLLMAAAVALGFILFSGAVEFFCSAKRAVVAAASKLVKETLATILDTLSVAPFLLKQLCLVAKSTIRTVLQIFIGYRSESEKNNAVFIAACFASLASLLNTFLGLYGFYGGRNETGVYRVILPLCTFAIACAVQLAMLIFGMKAGEGLAEWRITKDLSAKSKLLRILSCVGRALFLGAACLLMYTAICDIVRSGFHLETIPLAVGILICLGLLLMLRSRHGPRRRRKRRADQSGPVSAEESAPVPASARPEAVDWSNIPMQRPRRRLPFYWYLTAYLLLLIVSTGFAYSNLFGYYTHGAKVHSRVYSQVRYETDKRLDLSGRVAGVSEEYDAITRKLGDSFRKRTALAIQERERKKESLRRLADAEEQRNKSRSREEREYTESNGRDRFIGQTKDLEAIVSTIHTFLETQYDDVGSNVVITTEEYAHYWGFSPQPSYQTTCILLYLPGAHGDLPCPNITDLGTCNLITVGDRVEDTKMESFSDTANAELVGKELPTGRIADPASPSQSIIKTNRTRLNADKYSILKVLLSQYERLENYIYNFDTEDSSKSALSALEEPEFPRIPPLDSPPTYAAMLARLQSASSTQTVGALLYPGLDRLAQLDGIRANIVTLYRQETSDAPDDDDQDAPEPVPMSALPQITVSYLTAEDKPVTAPPEGEKGDVQEGSRAEALLEFEDLSAYIDKALNVDRVLHSFDTTRGGKEADETDSSAYTVQKYRNYAQGIARLEFQISYDALLHGYLNLNPVREDIPALYSASAIALFLLLICILIDLMAFFSGLLLFKGVYLFRKNNSLLNLGYLNYEAALSSLFTPPKDSHGRVLHLAFIYSLLYGEATGKEEPDKPEDGPLPPVGDPSPKGDGPGIGGNGGDNLDTRDTGGAFTPDDSGGAEEGIAPSDSVPEAEEETAESAVQPAPEAGEDEDQSAASPAPEAEKEAAESVAQPALEAGEDEDQSAASPAPEAAEEAADDNARGEEKRTLWQRLRLRTRRMEEEKAKDRFWKTEIFLQNMDVLHLIMSSPDYRVLSKGMRATLAALGIMGSPEEDPERAYASLRLWLHQFVQENDITFEELFPPEAD